MLIRLLPFVLFISVFMGCKKGEDDPKLSLRTRKARVAGEWTMSSGHSFVKDTYYIYNAFDYGFSKNSYSLVHDQYVEGTPEHYVENKTGTFSYTLKFDKDGTFRSVRKTDTITVIMNGTWNFVGKGDSYKNKERIVLNITELNNGAGFTSYTFSGNSTFDTYHVKELSSKKMVLNREESTIKSADRVYYLNEEYIFEQ